jgi:octaprenyl-diphosphate synthase
VNKSTRQSLIYILKNENKTPEKVKFVIETVKENGGIAYAEKLMNQYRDDAIKILHEFDENEVRNDLEKLVRFTTDRKY